MAFGLLMRTRRGQQKKIVIGCTLILGCVILFLAKTNTYSSLRAEESSSASDRQPQVGMKVKTSFAGQGSPFHVPDLFPLPFDMAGRMYDERGAYAEVNSSVSSSLIHSFSPYTEQRFREMMLDPAGDQRIYANSPAMLWRGDGKLLVIMRMWLEKEKYKNDNPKKGPPPRNDFSDNYLYLQHFDAAFHPLTPGRVLGIPTPTQWYIGDGPIEPRLFAAANRTFMTFNTGAILKDGTSIDSTFVWDFSASKLVIPHIIGGAPMAKHSDKNSGMARDKHWAAFEDKGELYFTYNLDPLRVLHCHLNFSCKFVWFDGPQDYTFKQLRDHVRGGTPWALYKYPYYISVAHGTFFKKSSWKRYYTTNIVVMSVNPTYRIVYTGSSIQVHNTLLASIPIVRFIYIHDPFLFPVSVILEDYDTLAIGLHVNDHSSMVIRLRGVEQLMNDVMRYDKGEGDHVRKGPPPGAVHTATRHLAEMQSKYKLGYE